MYISDYYNKIINEWGVTPTSNEFSGYETVLSELNKFKKDMYTNADEKGKEQLIEDVFAIYRSINIIPITYYSLEGCIEQIKNISDRSKIVENNSLAIGGNDGQSFCRFWFPNMQDAKWETNDTVSVRSRFMHDVKLKRAIKFCFMHRDNDGLVYPKSLRTALDLVNGGTIQNFKPMNARAIYEYICPVFGGDVLDFSSGYGGRMLGSMTSRMRFRYTGIDPNTKTYQGLCALGSLITDTLNLQGYSMHCMPSEEVKLEKGKYDAAFTSPPYFNLETYTDEPTQCMNRYPERERWFDGYVVPTLKNVYNALTDDAILAVNIADFKSNKIVDDWISISEKLGFKHVETIKMLLNVRPGVGNDRLKRNHKFEGVYIFRK